MIPKNLRCLSKGELIKIIRILELAIKVNCYNCMGKQKKVDCGLFHCSLYLIRPWVKIMKI